MKVLLTGDIHFGLNIDNPQFHDENIKLFEWFVSMRDKYDEIFILGDVFHNRKNICLTTLDNAHRCFQLLEQHNIKVRIITGNHDCYYLNNSDIHSLVSLQNFKNITIYDKVFKDVICGKSVTFLPWSGSDNLVIEPCDILMAHLDLVGFYHNAYNISSHGVDPESIPAKAVFTGHYHGHQRRNIKGTLIYYVGSPYQHNWGDVSEKYVHILDLCSNKIRKIENTFSPKHISCDDVNDIKSDNNFYKIEKSKIPENHQLPNNVTIVDKFDKDVVEMDLQSFDSLEYDVLIRQYIKETQKDDAVLVTRLLKEYNDV